MQKEKILGIVRTYPMHDDVPDYVDIAIKWYEKWLQDGKNSSKVQYMHYLDVAQEVGLCIIDPEATLDEFLN